MSDPTVTRTDTAGVATLTLQRPALSHQLRTELIALVRDVAADESVRAVLLTGSGRAFCVGQDLAEHVEVLRSGGPQADSSLSVVEAEYNPLLLALAALQVPLVVGAELLLLPEPFPAETAHTWGLVHRVVAPDRVLAESQALAARLAAGPTLAYRAIKEVLATAATDRLEDTLALEARLQTRLGGSADHREAVEAFLAKRPPEFTGR
jgi:2-(1,2-epoxy-1,2-dihydrophenyl)acetyl-CoA isomerase